MIEMKLFVIVLLFTNIRAQQNLCSCSCCRSSGAGQSCSPISLPSVTPQTCTLESCLAQCRATYYQCQGNTLADVLTAVPQCTTVTTIAPQFNCRCDCCNTGSPSCSVTYVGDALAYLCQAGSCSISCQQKYPDQCKADLTGLTQGACISSVTTTTTATTGGPWLGNLCKCTCCSTNSNCPSTTLGVASASSCSASACTQVCRNQYPFSCLSSFNTSQTSGTCLSDTGGRTTCNCECRGTNGYIQYSINTNENCSSCQATCQQNSPCTNTNQVLVQNCSTNNAKTIHPRINSLLLISIIFYSFYIHI